MIQLSRDKLSGPSITLHDHDLPQVCSDCGVKHTSHQAVCPACGVKHSSKAACKNCYHKLEDIHIQYTAIGPCDAIATKEYPAEKCPTCDHLYIWSEWPNRLDELVTTVPSGFRFIPEHGFLTSTFLEVFSFIHSRTRAVVRKSADGMSLRYGPQSSIFRHVADDVTDLDLGDHGLDVCPTMRVRPPPPYSPTQVSTLRLLLAQIEHAVDEQDSEVEEQAKLLLVTVMSWPHDTDRRALALVSAILNHNHPGIFVNAFRLLELVLEILLDAEIARKRKDPSVSDEAFVALAKTYKADLKTRLQRRIKSLPDYPKSILASLWHLIKPGVTLSEPGVFDGITQFRNKYVHGPDRNSDSTNLPWETPDFDRISQTLLELIVFILRVDPGGAPKGPVVADG